MVADPFITYCAEVRMQLNKEQLRAVNHVDGPMLVLAGPGSGKTHVLTGRVLALIRDRGIPPENILVITFSRKAALSMQHRFNALSDADYPVTFGTFHAVFFHILTYHGLYSKEGILNSKTKIEYIKRVGRHFKIENASDLSWQKDMLSKISGYKNIGDAIFDAELSEPGDNGRDEFFKIFNEYERMCAAAGVLDFDDMVYKCNELLACNEGVRSFWQRRYKYILIDEFQDINRKQYEVIKLLLDGRDKNIFAVGDDDQSIYGFRGAAPGIMKEFINDFAGCEVVNLQLNYRCAYEIVAIADRTIRHNNDRIERDMQKTLKGRKRGFTYIEKFESAEEEASYIINELGKYPPQDVAILYRSAHAISVLEDCLMTAGVNYIKSTPQISFYELESVKTVVSYFRIAADEATREDYLRFLNAASRNISREALNSDRDMPDVKYNNRYVYEKLKTYCEGEAINVCDRIDKWERDFEMIRTLPPIAALNYILVGMGLKRHIENNYKKDYRYSITKEELLEELKERFKRFDTIEGLLKSVKDIENARNCEEEDRDGKGTADAGAGVTLMSVHASKGLEFPVVFIPALQDGLFPHHKYLGSIEGIEEERRLLYVAITRAKDVLYLCARGTEHGKRVSRFIAEL